VREWDLNSAATRLEQAMNDLQATRSDVSLSWDDQTYMAFQEEYLIPLVPIVKRALEGIQRLADLMAAGHRDCRLE